MGKEGSSTLFIRLLADRRFRIRQEEEEEGSLTAKHFFIFFMMYRNCVTCSISFPVVSEGFFMPLHNVKVYLSFIVRNLDKLLLMWLCCFRVNVKLSDSMSSVKIDVFLNFDLWCFVARIKSFPSQEEMLEMILLQLNMF